MRIRPFIAAIIVLSAFLAPSTLAAEEVKFKSGLTAEPFGLGKQFDLSQYDLHTVDGAEAGTLADFGKYIYVDVWATWCGPCIGEIPNLHASQEKLGGDDFTVVGLSIDYTAEELEKYMAENEEHYPVYYDADNWKGKFATDFGVVSIPSLFLFVPDGVLIGRDIRGENMPGDIEAAMHADKASLIDVAIEMNFDLGADNFDLRVVKKAYDYESRGEQKTREFSITGEPMEVTLGAELAAGAVPDGKVLVLQLSATDFPTYMESSKSGAELPVIHKMPFQDGKVSLAAVVPPETYLAVAEVLLHDPTNPDDQQTLRTLWAPISRLGPRSKK